MKIGNQLKKFSNGLVLHYLQGRTVEQAVQEGERAALPEDLLLFPRMMFSVTSAAGAVFLRAKTLDEVLDALVQEGAPRDEAKVPVSEALRFMRALKAQYGEDGPVPQTSVPWFAYEELTANLRIDSKRGRGRFPKQRPTA